MSGYNNYENWPQESTSNTDEEELSSPEIEQDDSDDDSETSTSSTSTSASSSSGSSQSGSDSESTSTADEDETISLKTETVVANKTELSLPVGMCEDEEVFKQLFSVNSWVCLSDQQKQHLKNFLPTFPENDLMEKEITLRMLFGGQSFRFGVNPIDDFHDKLKNGYYRPDIVKMKSLLKRTLKQKYRKNQHINRFNTLKKLLSERLDLSKIALPMSNHFDPTEDMYREMLLSYKIKQKKIEQEKEQIRLDLMKEQIKPAVSLGNEKKRSATSDRSRVKRTKTEEEIVQERQIEVEPISLTADEILMAEEGQAAAAMLLEIMSDVEEKYNNSP
ncbi:uncharacterized protein LOC112689432 [Sipha flava]|uniref:Uncharacterized protein LOC112689432 n=1 Tax=Sipha flava TaxID=143950 RepID=A0A8B8G7V3_9HEMI|nr:uncharacterized protein LOC112689432 [Sipha flava]